jgi:hypothetical protein
MKICALMARGKDGSSAASQARIREAQQAFFDHLLRADYEIAIASEAHRPILRARMRDLRNENARAARELGYDKARLAAEQQPEREMVYAQDLFFALPALGTPTYWLPDSDGQPPQVRLSPMPDREVLQAVTATELFLLLLAGVVVLWFSPRVASWIYCFWPEQLMLVAWLGCEAFGLSPLGVVLFITGAFFRLVWIFSAIQRRFRPEPVPSA